MEVQAALVREPAGSFTIERAALGETRPNEVIVRIVGAGICHTDLICRDQYIPVPLPAVFGHEGSGIVEHCGEAVRKVKRGDRVVLSFGSCGACRNCQQGAPAYCERLYDHNFLGTRPDGTHTLRCGGQAVSGAFFGQSSFATYAVAHERNVVKVNDAAPLELLGPLGCGIQTGAGAVMNSLAPPAGSTIAIFGVGSVGLAAVMAAVIVGCSRIIAVDRNPARLALARDLGATDVIDAGTDDPVEAIRTLTSGGADFSLEATALPQVLRQAVDALGVRGTCGLIGAPRLGTEVSLDMWSILLGRTVRGIVEGDSIPDIFIPRLVDLFLLGRFPFDRTISTYPFAAINRAVEDVEAGRVVKSVLLMPAA